MRFINSDKNVVRRVVVVDYFFSAMVEKKALLAKARKMICFLRLRNFFPFWESGKTFSNCCGNLMMVPSRKIYQFLLGPSLLLTFAALPLSKKMRD